MTGTESRRLTGAGTGSLDVEAQGSVLRGSDGPLAAVHDVALLDLDGVVYVGAAAVAHAAASLDQARRLFGMRAAFVTNNASRPPDVVAEHLVGLGVRAEAADVVTSAQAGARVLAERLLVGARVLAIGGPGVGAALVDRGLVPVTSFDDEPAAVLQGYGPDVGWRQLAEGSLAISHGVPWVATNLDRTIPSPRGRVLGNGALVEALRHATGVDPTVAGKPLPPLMLESVERLRAVRPLVVGDRLDTDIQGARQSGIPSLLVLTGVTQWQELLDVPHSMRPTHLDRDLRGLLVEQPHVRVSRSPGSVVGACGGRSVTVPVRDGEPGDDAPAIALTDPSWWPPRLRAGDGPDDLDLDLARAVVSVAWAVTDAGLTIGGPARAD